MDNNHAQYEEKKPQNICMALNWVDEYEYTKNILDLQEYADSSVILIFFHISQLASKLCSDHRVREWVKGLIQGRNIGSLAVMKEALISSPEPFLCQLDASALKIEFLFLM